jgi:hypothetical protein
MKKDETWNGLKCACIEQISYIYRVMKQVENRRTYINSALQAEGHWFEPSSSHIRNLTEMWGFFI